MRALVTGAGGFVGATLVRRLLAEGHEVHATGRPGGQPWRLEDVRADIELHEVDLADAEAIARLVGRARPDWVFHLAAHGAYSWQTETQPILAVNVLGTAALLDAALDAGAQAFIHAGSSSEYGLKDHPPVEDEALAPNSTYAVGKAAATHYCSFVGQRAVARVATLRLYSIYGPWEDPGRLMPTLAVRGLRGELPPLVAPETARDFVHVDDACDAFVRAAQAPDLEPGVVLNLGSGRQTTLREIVAIAREVLAIEAEPQWGSTAARSWDTSVWVSDPRRIETALGWRASTDLREGFRDLADWLASDPDRLARYASVARR
ncbi:NAD-dependent epimerase/dehydratase family protein [Solirubrobacter sp. CPCC 204708]|uniref:NAD-dependent epimerase/dehydratase family protein n=1 Tax=Solirubrobacter deserti TaxID=2282478 RepID=A0ABT4RNK7_9ACTN|nr:NAD-dependent epimerase/dehydratase family protein [Solirubrobacter deserti]MBE2317426.1 NAD-dependent epimerase/dehydratase family protein [Solirubrobacter deserti]MDA0140008.1 NAD-dependent epimerase/dehydratase family protein [Solirubrobacter deserti]